MKNFFEHQDDAKQASRRLVVLFVVALIGIVAILYFSGILLASAMSASEQLADPGIQWWNPQMLGCVALITIGGIGGASLIRIHGLRGGGSAVAEGLGGRVVEPTTQDLHERQLVNIVEEMAIASGVPVPSVYVLDDEPGINAFAAGYEPSDAAIAVTRGALLSFTRDEMQGVIAHEYSHILHGDMRLNIRLIGVIYGLSLLGSTGLFLLRSSFYGAGRRRRNSNGDGGVIYLLAIGAVLAAAGYIGVLAGRLIQSAVSRQREYLADAAAVQFTRNPDGLASALRKVGGYNPGTWIRSSGAEEMSHMFFADGIHRRMLGSFSTHPPVAERIRRLDPTFDGIFHTLDAPEGVHAGVLPHLQGRALIRPPARGGQFDASNANVGASALDSGTMLTAPALAAAAAPATRRSLQQAPSRDAHRRPIAYVDPNTVADRVGTVRPEEIEYSRQLMASIPDAIRDGVRQPFEAVALVYAMLLDDDAEARQLQLGALKEISHPKLITATLRWVDDLESLDPRTRLPLIELAAPALRRLSANQYDAFRAEIDALIHADERVTLFEFVVHRSLVNALDVSFGRAGPPEQKYMALQPVARDAAVVLSAVAIAGTSNPLEAMSAFKAGRDRVPMLRRASVDMLSAQHCGIDPLGHSIGVLREASLGIRRMVLEACAHAVLSDRDVTLEEADLLRVIAESLGMPLPPFLPQEDANAPNE